MIEQAVRIHNYESASRANGPGLRAVVWVQGCTLACPGCFNPESHAPQGGERITVAALADRILSNQDRIEGLTLSGGEPLQQHRALGQLLREVRAASSLSTVVFTGYAWEELAQFPNIQEFLNQVDVLIAGRYKASQRVAQGLIGSANKTVHFLTSRYTADDLREIPQAEVILSPDGEIILSGIDPLQW
jgi:anaerobic ribonucleoside-triphosphate reductase activating protein